jgi:putative flavoprotein involved in K+ transport
MRPSGPPHTVLGMENTSTHTPERFDTVVIGGGQAGLAVGYYLAKQGRQFVILDASDRVGDAWRKRWDSLRLFTPAVWNGLPGWRFPGSRRSYPTKDEMADYLEAYAESFDLPVRSRVKVDALSRDGDRYVIAAGEGRFEADRVVVATGAHHVPRLPEFAEELAPDIVQLHSSKYRNPSQLQTGGVLVVGVGNSGAEIAFEVSRTHTTWLAGKPTGQVPVPHGSLRGRTGFRVFKFLGHRVLTRKTPIGRKVGPKVVAKGPPLIRVREKELAAADVERVPRVTGVRDGLPLLEDGKTIGVANVIWCTGFRQDHSWIDLPVFDEDGELLHDRGVVDSESGLYFVGLIFQYAVSSDVLPGVSRDARYVAKQIARRASRTSEANTQRDPLGAPASAR